ncbi:hypothetical protein H0I54_04975 [Yersinia kristensenii]|uniref:hypothetical protein n=1 Tax=Yersinia kristensenii TaxID=28152 RepID=UPI001C60C617|nr:hypothetical protein [Yersinia kristensenii]MBW5841164.1 hypothetical protein [Yersinia kristensenii]
MNEKTDVEKSRAWEIERSEKEKIRLRKEQAENKAWIKNKLKWLNKEPRAAFFFFFYLGINFQKSRGGCVVPKTEKYDNPLSAEALGTKSFRIAIDKTPEQQPEVRATIGGIAPTFAFNPHQNKSELDAQEMLEVQEKLEKNSLMNTVSVIQENPKEDIDKIINKLNTYKLNNKPANGVSFPYFVKDFTGIEDIPAYIIKTLSFLDINNVLGFIKETNEAWVRAQEDFQQAFSWMDIKNEQQCIWVWNTMKDKGVSPPVNPLNNFQRWHFICATFDLWQGWTKEQLDELTRGQKKISPQRLELKLSVCPPRKHKVVLMDELEKAWKMKLGRKTVNNNAELKLPAKIRKKLTKLSEKYDISELDMMALLIESECARNDL